VGGIRVVEVLAALSLTTDLASGVSFEKGLRTCAVATAFGRELGLPRDELSVVFHTALVRAIGCTSHASENADAFEDDIAFQAWLSAAARSGALDTEAVAPVIEAAGLPRPRPARPHDLTEREVDVLRLAARGLTNQQIAGKLTLSARTA
jgi:hypothetical protein